MSASLPVRRAFLFSLALAASTAAPLLAAPTAAQASACGTVLSATKNGVDASSLVSANCFSNDGAQYVVWGVDAPGGGNDLGAASVNDTYVITLDTGTTIPRVSDTKGAGVTVNRVKADDGHWHVTITAKPVLATGDCKQNKTPWTCPEIATKQWDGYVGGQLTDYGTWEDARQREAFFGMDYSSNIDAGSIPPQIVKDSAGAEMIFLELANSHFQKTPATTVFKGQVSVVIPNNFLKLVYEIDDPASLTTAGLDPEISGKGGGTVTIVDTGSALRVDVANLTFSQRNVKVHRGNIKPGKPGKLSADRKNAFAVKLSYNRAKARGSKIKGNTATCIAKKGPKHVVTVNDKRPSTTVTGLHANTEYTCKVRARSKAGNGGWAKISVAKKP